MRRHLHARLRAVMEIRRCAVTVRGPIAPPVLDTIRARFGEASASGTPHTTLVVKGKDQAAVRALLALLWDAGHDVLALTNTISPDG